MKQSNPLIFVVLAVVADLLTFAAARFLLPQLVPTMTTLNGRNALLLAVAFFLFATGVFLFRRLKAAPPAGEWLGRGGRIGLALVFSLVFSLALAWQLGFFASAELVDTRVMGEGGAASYFVLGPGAWLAFSLLYVLVFGFTVEPRYEPGSREHGLAGGVGLALTAVLLVVLAAQAAVVGLSLGDPGWWPVAAFVLLVVMFLPPRLVYLSRTVGLRNPSAFAVVAVFLLLLLALCL